MDDCRSRLRRISAIYDKDDVLWLIHVAEAALELAPIASALVRQVEPSVTAGNCAHRIVRLNLVLREQGE